MSLAQHVSAVEGPDRVDLAGLYDPPDSASLRTESLQLSYDPLPKADVFTEKAEPVGAYKISNGKRIGTYFGTLRRPLANGVQHK